MGQHSKGVAGISYQCNNWCPLMASRESRYQWHCGCMVCNIKTYQWYDFITAKRSWTLCSVHNEWQNIISLQWRQNGRDGVSNHQPHGCLPFIRVQIKKGAHTTSDGQRYMPTSRNRRSSRLSCCLLLNSWIGFWSYHYLCVNFYCAWCVLSMPWSLFKKNTMLRCHFS